MKKRGQEKTTSRNAAATVYADAEFPHLTEDQGLRQRNDVYRGMVHNPTLTIRRRKFRLHPA